MDTDEWPPMTGYERRRDNAARQRDDLANDCATLHALDWREHGACRGMPTDWFFPERGASWREAKATCATCPVQTECLEYALDNGEKFGIWGMTTERERRVMRREQREAVA